MGGTLDITHAPGVDVLVLHGEHDLSTQSRLEARIDAALDAGKSVVVDLSEVDFIDSTVLAAILHGQRRASPENGGCGPRLAVVASPGAAFVARMLSFVHIDTWRFGYNVADSREQARDRGLEAARKAVKLDPLNSLGYHALFLVQFALGDLKGFHEAGNRCLELNPNDTEALADLGLHMTMSDDWTVGMLLLKVALALNPEPADWFWIPFFAWHFQRDEFDAALDMALRCHSEGFYWTHAVHAAAYAALDMREEATAAVARLLQAHPEFPRMAREELARWVSPERQERALEILRRAGVPIPEDGEGARGRRRAARSVA